MDTKCYLENEARYLLECLGVDWRTVGKWNRQNECVKEWAEYRHIVKANGRLFRSVLSSRPTFSFWRGTVPCELCIQRKWIPLLNEMHPDVDSWCNGERRNVFLEYDRSITAHLCAGSLLAAFRMYAGGGGFIAGSTGRCPLYATPLVPHADHSSIATQTRLLRSFMRLRWGSNLCRATTEIHVSGIIVC